MNKTIAEDYMKYLIENSTDHTSDNLFIEQREDGEYDLKVRWICTRCKKEVIKIAPIDSWEDKYCKECLQIKKNENEVENQRDQRNSDRAVAQAMYLAKR